MTGPVQIPDDDHEAPVDVLRRGVAAWNAWYRGRRDGTTDLSGADLSELDLAGIDLSGANLKGADFFRSNLTRANLKMAKLGGADFSNAVLAEVDAYKADFSGAFLSEADLTRAYLSEADFTGADLRAAKLSHANLRQSRLTDAKLGEAQIHNANLNDADLTRADLRFADLDGSNLTGMRFGRYREMEDRYYGIRGLGGAYGNALFERAAKDQDFLDTLKIEIERMAAGPRKRLYRTMYSLWGLIDYGRSLLKVSLYAAIIAAIYGTVFAFDLNYGWGLMNYNRAANSWFTPYYCSIVTYTTLGFGDVTAGNWIGEILVITEVIAGYFTLGLLLSILANTIARRS